MKIISLKAENVKRIKAVRITPDGSMVVVGGMNDQGKTTVLDCIKYAMRGKGSLPSKPVREGAKKGKIELELDDLMVTRTITPSGGGGLVVSAKDIGAKYPSPQAMLDKLVGKLGFDPLAFTRLDKRSQLEAVKGLVGLDFTELDRERSEFYEKRTSINRNIKELDARAKAAPHHEDAPKELVSISRLVAKLKETQAYNAEAYDIAQRLANARSSHAALEEDIKHLQGQLENLKEQLEDRAADSKKLFALTIKNPVVDTSGIEEQMEAAEDTNKQVRENQARDELIAIHRQQTEEAELLSSKIEHIDSQKVEQLQAAEFPVEGLSFDDNGLTYNDIPFDQASSAQQLRVSVAMGLAMNPELRVLLIRDGSLLDEQSLAAVAEMAEEADAQVWIERVGEGAECSVIIEDGEIEPQKGSEDNEE